MFLGQPFSMCVDNALCSEFNRSQSCLNEQGNICPCVTPNSNANYTRNKCRQQAIAKEIIKQCKCKLKWWPKTFSNGSVPACIIRNEVTIWAGMSYFY